MLKKIVLLNLLSGITLMYAAQSPKSNRRVSHSSSSNDDDDGKLRLSTFVFINSAHNHPKGTIDSTCSACEFFPEHNKATQPQEHRHKLSEYVIDCPQCKIIHNHSGDEGPCVFCDKNATEVDDKNYELRQLSLENEIDRHVRHLHFDKIRYAHCPGCQKEQEAEEKQKAEAWINKELDAGCTIS